MDAVWNREESWENTEDKVLFWGSGKLSGCKSTGPRDSGGTRVDDKERETRTRGKRDRTDDKDRRPSARGLSPGKRKR